jgi:hypothetical protein
VLFLTKANHYFFGFLVFRGFRVRGFHSFLHLVFGSLFVSFGSGFDYCLFTTFAKRNVFRFLVKDSENRDLLCEIAKKMKNYTFFGPYKCIPFHSMINFSVFAFVVFCFSS